MKKNYSFLFLFLFVLLTKISFSQTNGWVCKSGWYGSGPCPYPLHAGVCPTFNTVLNICPCINTNGINAQLNTGVDRQTIVDSNYYGTGIDPNSASPYLIHVVDSGSANNYSLRLGDAVARGTNTTACYTGICNGPGCYARAESFRLTFAVTAQNAIFTYHYSAFLDDSGPPPEEQPRFEVLITQPDSGDALIPGGYLKIIALNSNPYCPGSPNFHTNGSWFYTDWTGVTTDLTNYIGQNIAVEFRTSDEFEGTAPTTVINGVCTTTTDHGVSCVFGPSLAACPDSGTCTGTYTCTNQPGTSSAYAYIDVSGFPFFNGINELNNTTSIRIYPNPMTSSSIIEIVGKQNAEVVIYDMLGKELIRRKLTANKTEIQKGDLERGVYFVRVNESVKKLIVE